MLKEMLHEAYNDLLEDTKFIRLATITTIFHSFIFVFYIIYQTYFFVTKIKGSSIDYSNITQYMEHLLGKGELMGIHVTIAVILLIGYFLLPPIGEGAMIYYVNNKNKGGRSSLTNGFKKFFPMFEFDSMIGFFNLFIYIIAVSRLYIMGVLFNTFVIIIMIIWLIFILGVSLLLPYTKFLITLQENGIMESIKGSINLSVENPGLTFRLVFVNYLLYIRFFLNIIIILGIPLLILYIAGKLDFSLGLGLKTIIYSIFAILIFLAAYINGIIEAFFVNYWFKAYKSIIPQNENINVENNQ